MLRKLALVMRTGITRWRGSTSSVRESFRTTFSRSGYTGLIIAEVTSLLELARARKILSFQDFGYFLRFSNLPTLRVFVFGIDILSKRIHLESQVVGDLFRSVLHRPFFRKQIEFHIPRASGLTQK